MPQIRASRARLPGKSRSGFTLLEIILAVTLLAVFLLPMLLIISNAKVRAIRYTQQREVRDLAQRKLFDRIHYYEEGNLGTFALEGHPEWNWEVLEPEMMGASEQVLLQYTIRVHTPQKIGGESSNAVDEEGSTYEMTVWAFPDARWYEDQAMLYERGGYSPFYGSHSLNGGSY